MNEKNANETRMQKPLSGKGDIRYWQKRVRKTRSVRGDSVTENAFYSVELQHTGRRMGLSLTDRQPNGSGGPRESVLPGCS
jgi:hypothetical protein